MGEWLGYRDSNPNKQSQSLSCYRYTISQRNGYIIARQAGFVKGILKKFGRNFLFFSQPEESGGKPSKSRKRALTKSVPRGIIKPTKNRKGF